MSGPIEKFREGQKDPLEPLTDVYNDRMGTYTLVHCCDDLDEARRYGIFPAVESWYRSLIEFELRWEIDEFEEAQKRRFLALLEPGAIDAEVFLAKGNVIVGTPEQCLEQMLGYADIGVDHLLCYQQFGGIPHERIMRSIELLGTKVIPELEARGHRHH
jgi:alkanesulfonate monooxygenase SsuD/methylene tetrahydromethanopterin reductase-like flavin-dependent oxidoreductase (luciferase family)